MAHVRTSSRLAAVSTALLLPSFVFAASTWNLGSGGGCAEGATNAGSFGNAWSCAPAGGGIAATATALSNTGSGSTFAVANAAQYGTAGMGVRNSVEGLSVQPPDHSLDNNVSTDLLQLSFGSNVALTQVALGWYQGDSDISVLRYSGSTTPAPLGKDTAQLLASGWELVGNYLNVGSMASSTTAVNAGNLSSSWWIISAYNAGYGGSTTGTDTTADYVKVLAVAGTPVTTSRVPEPASLSLAGVALLAIFGVSRRPGRKAALAA